MTSRRLLAVAATFAVGSFAFSPANAFITSSPLISASTFSSTSRAHPSQARLAARTYGPSDDVIIDQEQEEWEKENDARVARQKVEFAQLLLEVVGCTNVDHLPGIMTRRIDLILNMQGFEGVAILKEAIEEAQQTGDEERIFAVESAVNLILTFAEEFVSNAASLDDGNKQLLGKIVKEITSGWDSSSASSKSSEGKGFGNAGGGGVKPKSRPGIDDEARLDALFEREKENFTPGFLRHLEGECKRIASAPRLTPESGKMLETLRMIQARVVEELGQELGEGAVVLGQLLGYDDRSERLAVLDAGLTVRGVPFAKELVELTEEALEGFERVPGGADPDLVRIVTEIDERIRQFIDKKSE